MKQLEIKLIALSIIAFLMYLCKDTLNEYMSHFLSVALALSVVVSFYFVVAGLYKLAMLRLDYMERVGQVAQANRQTLLLSAGQSAVIFDNDSQTMVTAPTQQQLSAPAQPMVEATPQILLPPKKEDVFELMNSVLNMLIIAAKGAGKTSLIKWKVDHEIEQGNRVIVLDPHAKLNTWNPLAEVVVKLDDIMNMLEYAVSLYQERTTKMNNSLEGEWSAQPVFFVCDEMTQLSQDIPDLSTAITKLLNGRKQGIGVIISGHSVNSEAIGTKGNASLVKNYDLIVDIAFDDVTEKREFKACTQPDKSVKHNTKNDMWKLCELPKFYNPSYEPRTKVRITEDSPPPTFQPSAEMFSLNRKMSQHEKLVMALQACYPDGLPDTKAEIHRMLGIPQSGNNIYAVNRAIEAY